MMTFLFFSPWRFPRSLTMLMPYPAMCYVQEPVSESVVEHEEPAEPPTYDAFETLLNPEAAKNAEEPEPEPLIESKTKESDAKQMKKQANVSRAKVLEREQRIVEATVWQVNASGVLVQARGVTGFVPFNQLSKEHKFKVSDAQKQAQRVIGGSTEDAKVRKAGMHVLTGSVLHVTVMSVDEEAGRVIFTERVKRQNQTVPLTESILKQVSQQVGNIVDAHVRNVRDFGVFVDFPIHDQVSNAPVSILGLVYTTEVSWDAERPHLSPGDTLKAKVIHVDIPKKHIFLSFKRTTPNPLLETLDSLLDARVHGGGSNEEDSRTTFDASSDMRPLLGDLEDAVKLKSLLEAVQGVRKVTLGPRLQSRASSQNVEIYLAKAEESNGTKKVIVRRGYDVQEMAIQSSALVSRQDLIDIISQQQQ